MSARSHAAFVGLAGLDVDNAVEEVGLAVLAAEVLRDGAGSVWKG